MTRVRAIIHYSEKSPISGPYKRIKLHGKDAHVNLAWEFSQIESLTGSLSDEAKDLVDIAVGTYLADIITSRSKSFYHDFVLTVQVRNLSLWEDLREDLNLISSYLMRSPVEYRFLEGPREKGEPLTSPSLTSIESVACLSGGIDSCLGAASLARESNTLLMSQYTCPSLLNIQRRIVSSTPFENPTIHLPVFVRKKGHLGATESYLQPSRSMLYLALTGSIAATIGSRDIYMFENGPMSIGIPYTSARFHTRTVHPIVLDRFQHVIRGIPGGESVKVHNPFGGMTKADEILEYHGLVPTDVLYDTCSCSMRDRVKAHRSRLGKDDYSGCHCGYCLPCIHRRLSFVYAGLEEPEGHYLFDLFRDYPFDSGKGMMFTTAIANIRDLTAFASVFESRGADELYELFPDLFFETERISYTEVIRMHKRLAGQVLDTLLTNGNHRLVADVEKMRRAPK